VLRELEKRGKPITRDELRALARHLAGGSHQGDVTLLRLQEYGYIALEYRLLTAGVVALQEAHQR
jgi:hypothetical protein